MAASLTISGLGQTITLSKAYTGHSGSPAPYTVEEAMKRAIVQHEPIGVEFDIGQDMGKHSDEVTVTGICGQADRTKFKALADAAQFPSAKGSITLTYVGDNQSGWTRENCVIKSFISQPKEGSPYFYKYQATFAQFAGQS